MQRVVKGDENVGQLIADLDQADCRYVHRVCSLMVKKKELPNGLVRALMKAVTGSTIPV
jgi:hypothetical protein